MNRYIQIFSFLLLLAVFAGALTSCSLVDEDLDECRYEYRLRFKFDYNVSGGDAFASQVTSVRAWIYDQEGNFVTSVSDSGDALKEPGYSLPVSVPAGTYDVVVWCGVETGSTFQLTTAALQPSMTSLGVDLRLTQTRANEEYDCHTWLTPLFHGYVKGRELTAPEGQHSTQYIDVPLVKDTNHIGISLVQISGQPIGLADFLFTIEAENSQLAWNNDVLPGRKFNYYPAATTVADGVNVGPAGTSTTSLYGILAEFSTSRLMADRRPVLSIKRMTDGKEIIRIDLVNYLLWAKGQYNSQWSAQEYLDRVDDYSITFFCDKNMDWYLAGGVIINGWTMVPEQDFPAL